MKIFLSIITSIMIFIVIYGLAAFVSAIPNPTEWSLDGRFVFSMVWFWGSFVSTAFVFNYYGK